MQGDPPGRAEARWTAAGTVLAVLVSLALIAGGIWLVDRRDADSRAAAPGVTPTATAPASPTVDPSVLRLQALDELLEARSSAVSTRDQAAWLATVDAESTVFAQRQAEVFANLQEVPLAEWRYEYAGDGPSLSAERLAVLGPDAWVARVVLVYELGDGGLGEVRREQYLTLVRRDSRWLLADDTDGGSAPDLWDLGPVQVVRGERSLVLGTADQDVLERYATESDAAVARVDQVWGTEWPRPVVVMVPQSQEEMARLLLRPNENGLEQIAAVTTGEVGLDEGRASTDRVIVNPAGFAQLGPLGRQVVLTHEITHVATRATTTEAVPIWLSEGFADYVAYRETGVSRAVIAQDVLDRVRDGQTPTSLPTSTDFDPARGEISPAYSGAWLAAELIARRWGQEPLVQMYRSVASGTAVEEALGTATGLGEDAFTEEWRAYLEELAS